MSAALSHVGHRCLTYAQPLTFEIDGGLQAWKVMIRHFPGQRPPPSVKPGSSMQTLGHHASRRHSCHADSWHGLSRPLLWQVSQLQLLSAKLPLAVLNLTRDKLCAGQ